MFAQTDKIREKRNKKPTLFFKNQLIISATKFLHFTDIKDILYLKIKSYSGKIRRRYRLKKQSFNLPINYYHLSKNIYFIKIQNDRFANLNMIKSKYILHNSLMMPKLINRTIIIISFYNILQNLLK